LKPVVCRRVVGRPPPSARNQWWHYLVRSLGFHPSLPLTTGTFNLVVKEPNRLPPERRAFSPVQVCGDPSETLAPTQNPPVLETYTSYPFRAMAVNPLCRLDFHRFSTLGNWGGTGSQTRPGRPKPDSSFRTQQNATSATDASAISARGLLSTSAGGSR